MPQFRYIVVNNENRQLSGVIDSPDEKTAHEDLQALGFSVVSLEVEEAEKTQEDGLIFEFEGTDPRNKTISGTIKSKERYSAFRRLITEYELEVHYIVKQDLNKAEKEKQKKAGIIDLMKKYQEEVKTNTAMFHEEKIKKIDRNFEKEKALVMRQADFVLSKVGEAIDSFGKDLNPQNKQTIKNFVNKILRLKNTTNLEYLRKSCRDLLQFLQSAEIFTHKQKNIHEKVALYADAQEMIDTIQKGKDFGLYEDLEDQILRWQSEHISGKEKIPLSDKLKGIYYSLILIVIHEPEEVRTIKKQLHHLGRELKQYYAIYLKAKDPIYRKEASLSIKTLKKQKKNLKKEISIAKANVKKEKSINGEATGLESITHIVNGVSGWLLFFYLTYYFIATILITKQVGYANNEIPSLFFIMQTGLITYLLPIIFLLHLTTSAKLLFFRKNILATALLFPLFFIGSLLIVFNF